MDVVNATVKKWGNSVGVILPKELGFDANDEVTLRISRKAQRKPVGAIFGLLKGCTLDTKAVLDELDEVE